MSNELIREMVEALETCKSTPLNMVGSNDGGRHLSHDHNKTSAALAKARAYLASGGWTRVEDGLPVVPDGLDHVEIFFFCAQDSERRVGRRLWLDVDAALSHGITHWRYAESTPESPKG